MACGYEMRNLRRSEAPAGKSRENATAKEPQAEWLAVTRCVTSAGAKLQPGRAERTRQRRKRKPNALRLRDALNYYLEGEAR